jgi:integrase
MVPTPRWDSSKGLWILDLRTPWKLGRHVLHEPSPPSGTVPALHAAYALLAKLQADAPLPPQLALPGTAGRTVAAAIDQYIAERKFGRSRRWFCTTANVVKKELGAYRLADMVPPRGTEILWAWKKEVRGRGTVGPRTMKDRIQVLRMVLRWACEPPRLWIPHLPPFPDPRLDEGEQYYTPLTEWVDEPTFRAVRDAIYLSEMGRGVLRRLVDRGVYGPHVTTVEDYVARRRLYLSFAFYTGMRRQDLNLLDDHSVSLDLGAYWRFGRKTSDQEGLPESICEPLLVDLEFERRRLGRPYRKGELICGGPWLNACGVIRRAAKQVETSFFDLMTLRRSFCYHKALAGVLEEDLVRLMGHSDSKMIRNVYLQIPSRSKRNEAGAAWPKMRTSAPGTGAARISPIRAPKPALTLHSQSIDLTPVMHSASTKSTPKHETGG